MKLQMNLHCRIYVPSIVFPVSPFGVDKKVIPPLTSKFEP